MALFKRNYEKPGPGVPKNAPRKQGPARLVELLGRETGNLIKLNLLYQLCILPAQVAYVFCILLVGSTWFWPVLILALMASAPVGPATTAQYYCISKMLRDDPGFIAHEFWKRFRQNFKASVVPGILYALLLAAQLFALLALGGQTDVWALVAFLLSVLLLAMAAPYYFLQVGYLQLKPGALLRNSLLFAMGYLPRSLAGALLGNGLLALQFLLFPAVVPVTLLLGYSLPALLCLLFIWPPVEKTFHIEKAINEKREQQAETDEDAKVAPEEDETEDAPLPEEGAPADAPEGELAAGSTKNTPEGGALPAEEG